MTDSTAAALLWLLLLLFVGRVLGQLLVALGHPRWLPPMEAWFSGLLAYPLLLATQVVLVMVMAGIAVAVGNGWLADRRAPDGYGPPLVALGSLYAGAMVVRYAVRMWRRPDQRWLGGTIPIAFHLVLAAWLIVLGSYLGG